MGFQFYILHNRYPATLDIACARKRVTPHDQSLRRSLRTHRASTANNRSVSRGDFAIAQAGHPREGYGKPRSRGVPRQSGLTPAYGCFYLALA